VGPAMGFFDEVSANSTLEVQAKIGIVGNVISPLKLGLGVVKSSRACRHT
jgi:hypothetical protein